MNQYESVLVLVLLVISISCLSSHGLHPSTLSAQVAWVRLDVVYTTHPKPFVLGKTSRYGIATLDDGLLGPWLAEVSFGLKRDGSQVRKVPQKLGVTIFCTST